MREKSYMMAVPEKDQDLMDLEGMLNRLSQVKGIQVISKNMDSNIMKLDLIVEEEQYQIEIYPTGFELPEMYRIQHFFPDVDIEALQQAETGLAVEMIYGEDALSSYHAQLRIIHALLPDKLAIFDDSSEKILSGQWAALAASSKTPPAPRYIYTVQAVSGDDDIVWLHSHGLDRCGLPELEILDSSKSVYQSHYSVIEIMANRMLEFEEPLESMEPLFLAHMTKEISLISTLVPWDQAIEHYDDHMLGGKIDREESHNGHTSAIFVYPTYEDYQEGKYAPISIYDEYLQDNPLYMVTTKETERMKALAAERLEYMKRAFDCKDNHILVKLGLEVDDEYKTEDNFREHIWFELLDIKEDSLTAKLTQEPYYIENLHEGYTGDYALGEITDWMIYTPERRITPDDIYLMEVKDLPEKNKLN
nr:DUF4026 domain-containing protein [uncultured Aminipila sp.]